MSVSCLYIYVISKEDARAASFLSTKCIKPADFNDCQTCNVTYSMAVGDYLAYVKRKDSGEIYFYTKQEVWGETRSRIFVKHS